MQFSLPDDFFVRALETTTSDLAVAIEHALLEHAGGQAVVATHSLELHDYSQLGLCEIEQLASPRPIKTRNWGGEDYDFLVDSDEQSLWAVRWQDQTLHVLYVSWPSSCGRSDRHWVIAETSETADAFILDVERKTNDPGEALLVFRNGYWRRSTQLYQTVQQSSFDDLVMDPTLKESIRTEFKQFLCAREQYGSLGLAWRRGALFIGPPGNGKTHCVRALVKELNVPSLYVQSLSHNYYESEQLLQSVFDRARELRPCVLIFEDLDSLVDEDNQSFFLNQLDGFEKNVGLIVLATTNHPERIDPAILNRPSRFDRKYHFGLPGPVHREMYLNDWRDRLDGRVQWSMASLEPLVDGTDQFSFAYLKELVVSSLLSHLADDSLSFEDHLMFQCKILAKQMRTAPVDPSPRKRRRRARARR